MTWEDHESRLEVLEKRIEEVQRADHRITMLTERHDNLRWRVQALGCWRARALAAEERADRAEAAEAKLEAERQEVARLRGEMEQANEAGTRAAGQITELGNRAEAAEAAQTELQKEVDRLRGLVTAGDELLARERERAAQAEDKLRVRAELLDAQGDELRTENVQLSMRAEAAEAKLEEGLPNRGERAALDRAEAAEKALQRVRAALP